MSYTLFIDPLPRHFTSAELAELVRPFGRIVSAKVVYDSLRQSLRFGRVEMETEEEADNACTHLHGTVFHGATLTVLRADELKTDPADRHAGNR